MSAPDTLSILLISESTPGTGATAIGVDADVDCDDAGLPQLGGRRLRSVLRDTWLTMSEAHDPAMTRAAMRVFGIGGAMFSGILDVRTATLEDEVVAWAHDAVDHGRVSRLDVTDAFTTIRHQTAISPQGAPKGEALRDSRVVVRGLGFVARLGWQEPPTDADVRVLAMACLGTRHLGLARNRGRGFAEVTLGSGDATQRWERTVALALLPPCGAEEDAPTGHATELDALDEDVALDGDVAGDQP